ncbi:hypothetical protein SAMN02744040_02340 [Tepidibacter thalassicus DSM 15285]|uniref:Uncharacterized protein n=1 Tax=Tepidibacter thalassicus DSM 15285 TaxID=1123350 RepID=A0A1M5TYE8_9FIRM|nr:hypothetical protein SAMN02744040_02340 [Tepidibacter thalassicus DSM 15285]
MKELKLNEMIFRNKILIYLFLGILLNTKELINIFKINNIYIFTFVFLYLFFISLYTSKYNFLFNLKTDKKNLKSDITKNKYFKNFILCLSN